MDTHQALSILAARTKLLKRHIAEWTQLLRTQRQVRRLIHDHFDQKTASLSLNKTERINQLTKKTFRQYELIIRQTMARQQLIKRQQREVADFEKTINTL